MTTLSKIINYEDMRRITAEFSRLGEICYLENAGATLYPQSLLQRINEDLMKNVYMNPHTDKYTKDCIEQIRFLILKHFNVDPSEYSVVFTSGTTQALKLVVESFQFASEEDEVLNCGSFVYLRDNHTSVLGLREIASDKNADIIHIAQNDFLESLEPQTNNNNHDCKWKEKYKNEGNTLLVYPAQSNFNGTKYPLDCIENIKEGCLNTYIKKSLCKVNCNWYVLLDAASYVSTNKLDLSRTQADFVCLSFYKIFGYPTGLGALIVKNSSANVLSQKRYFGGGTVDVVLSSEDYHVKRQNFHERFEDGTLPFLAIVALKHCFDLMNEVIPKIVHDDLMTTISFHTFYLAQDLYNQLITLEHPNGVKAAVLYIDSDFTDIEKQGGIVTFNLMRQDKSYIGYAEFQRLADLFGIHVRTGCFCNSGSCQKHLNATNKEMKDMYKAGHKCGDDLDLINGKPTGAIRASFGYYNTYEDVDKLVQMICRCFVTTKFKAPKRKMITYKDSALNGKSQNSIVAINGCEKILKENQVFKTIDLSPEAMRRTANDIELTEMAIYPVKSCGAFKIKTAWKIGTKGFEYDREWMIVKDNGVCLTQKQNVLMCLIVPRIDLKNKLLILSFRDMPSISIPLEPKLSNKEKEASICQTKVCSDMIKGIDCGDQVADWISEALETSYLRLIKQSDVRKQKQKGNGEEQQLNLSNQAQYLLINRATVKWLSDKIKDPEFDDTIDRLTDRFRGNIIIDMDTELVEREWQRVIIGKHEFQVEGTCSRCQMVCIDQHTAKKTVEPLRTISQVFGGKLRFGIYLTYVGAVDGSRDNILKNYSPVQPLTTEDDISRFQDWFIKYFITNCSCPNLVDFDGNDYFYTKKL